MTRAPGVIRDSIVEFLTNVNGEASISEIINAVTRDLGGVPQSSVRSYLNLNVPTVFERTGLGRYRLKVDAGSRIHQVRLAPAVKSGKATLYHADCFDWLADQPPDSFHAVVTDPPYGLTEYSEKEIAKLRSGNGGGIWRVPPSFDGNQRSPLPRFTVMTVEDRKALYSSFKRLGVLFSRVVVPGGNVIVASNPLLAHIVTSAMTDAGLEARGTIVRTTMTMRGGDRPKNAHEEFDGVSVLPRSMWEPWIVLRRPLEGRVQDNLRKWGTGGFRRPSAEQPFGDVIRSNPTGKAERALAAHPSLKPQDFLRKIVRASLPLGKGIVLDPFAGSASTLAAANAVRYSSIGVESDPKFFRLAADAIPALAKLRTIDPALP